ncbi:MAG: DUF4248 domain-containing protein [Chitinophagaceae bacterium]|nr:DUF4248 domain-containing protein [Chitinophagaceae bacterium]
MTKTKTKSELAKLYGVHASTFMNWIKEIPNLNLKPNQKIFTPKQVGLIYEHLGEP